MPICFHVINGGKVQGNTWIGGGTDRYKLLKVDPLSIWNLSYNIFKPNMPEYSGYYPVRDQFSKRVTITT